jgi:polysaccharide biosynthesis protein PslH
MRIVHMTPELPHLHGGGGGRAHELLMCRRMVELGHEVLNISPVLPSEAGHAGDLISVGVQSWVSPRPASHLREAAKAVLSEPLILGAAVTRPVRALEMRVFWVRLRELVRRAATQWRPDVVIVVHGMAAAWARGFDPLTPAVLGLHDLQWRWYAARAADREGPGSWLLGAEAKRYRCHVLAQLPRYQAAVALSTDEAQELRAVSDIPVSVIPVGVDTKQLRPAPEQEGPPRLVFTGTLDYVPNVRGIRWFADHVWPHVQHELPDAQLDVVGRKPTPDVLALGRRPGITVVGPVPSMAPYFQRAHAVVVPILEGTGVRVKIVEAMAAGRAIVTTSLGWEGLPYIEPGRHLLVADDPREFARSVVSLLDGAALRRQLAGDARRLAERHYDWRRLGDAQEAMLREVVERSGWCPDSAGVERAQQPGDPPLQRC